MTNDDSGHHAPARRLTTRCAIAGGGPAGMMLGLLLARAGLEVVVLEKHADFLRDFRGDTLHPSTMEVMRELGLLDRLLELPHQKIETLSAWFGDRKLTVADFSHLPVAAPYIALMPQWDFLDFLSGEAGRNPGFTCLMSTEATGLVERDGRVAGVVARGPDGPLEILADLVVGADGRRSTVREQAGLQIEDLGAPIDVMWFRLGRRDSDGEETAGRFGPGKLLIPIYRGDYWQCAFVIPKGEAGRVRERGIENFRDDVAALSGFERARLDEIESFDAVSVLSVSVDRLKTWHRPGLLCIGDAAHAMSPIGGVGINLAIQDAVAAANILAAPLSAGAPSQADLAKVAARRMFPTRITQRAQVAIQNGFLAPLLSSRGPVTPPLPARLLDRFPLLRRIPARLVGLGVRPEHVSPVLSPGP